MQARSAELVNYVNATASGDLSQRYADLIIGRGVATVKLSPTYVK